eukprot:748935-Prymnesium_polylepis.4
MPTTAATPLTATALALLLGVKRTSAHSCGSAVAASVGAPPSHDDSLRSDDSSSHDDSSSWPETPR